MNRAEAAVADFQQGFNCSQAILSHYGEGMGVDRDALLRVAAGFGGGMGRMAGTCGVVTGACMAIGLKHGATTADDQQAKDKTYRLVREFAERFRARNGSVVCRDLLACDISTPEGLAKAKQGNLFATVCPKLVRDAGEILDEML